MIGEAQAIVHFLANHYEKEIAQYLHPFWYHYYTYIDEQYSEIQSVVMHSQEWIEQVTDLIKGCSERLFFYSQLPVLSDEQKHHFLSSIQSRLTHDIALGVCLPHVVDNERHVLGLWENTYGNHMRLHVRPKEIRFGFVIADDTLYFERPTQAEDTKRHIYQVNGVKEETVAYLLKNPQLNVPKLLQNYFLI